MPTPAAELAEIVVERLKVEGLIGTTDLESIRIKIASGTIKAEDWRLAIEKQLFKEATDE